MARNTFATIGILALLLMSLGMVSANVSENNVTISLNQTSISNVSAGETYSIIATIENLNDTSFYVEFRTTNWDSWIASKTVANQTSENFTGIFTIPASVGSRGAYADIYNESNHSQLLFTVSKSVTLTYLTATTVIQGCMTSGDNNYSASATVHNESFCTGVPTPTSTYDFCEINGKVGDLEIVDVTFNNFGEGEDDDWFLLDEVEIEVEIENTHSSENVKDVLVEIKILDSSDNDVTSDFDFDDEEISLNTIKDGDSEIATFKIGEIPADLDSGSYRLYIKAYSEDNESEQCVAEAASKYLSEDFYQKIEVTREDDPAVIVKETLLRIPASCGERNVELPLSIYNLGSDKEDKVLVHLYNTVLGINEKIIIDNLKSGKKKEITFYFDVPQTLSKDLYILDIVTYYDYDDDEDEMLESSYSENSEDDLDKDFSAKLEISSCAGPTPTINANLESAAEIGTDLVVKAIITNNGEDNDFVISASDFDSWASLVSVTPQTASINKGEFTEVTITFKPKVAGAQSFKINSIVDGESYSQLVSVNIDEDEGFFFGMNDILAYMIIGIAAVLVLIFLVLFVRVSRRQVKPQF